MADLQRFLHDIRDHQMTIELDQGVHRCLFFGRPRSAIYHFRLVTWPGHLSISGDCGDYTFARLRDMFEFFRYAGPEYDREDGINEGYWSGKLTAIDKHGGRDELDEDAYVQAIRSDFASHISGMDLFDAKRAVREAQWDYLFDAPTTEREATDKAMGWKCPVTSEHPFSDFYEHRITKTSFRLVWCMRAIQWGIKQYDLHKQGRTQSDHDRRVLAGAV